MSLLSANKTSSLLKILQRIGRGGRITAAVLAAELGVTERSVCRYLNDLQNAGYPIYFNRSEMSYRFVDGFELIPGKSKDDQSLRSELNLKLGMIGATPIGLIAYDAQGQCVMCNQAISAITGFSREHLLAQNYHAIAAWRESGLMRMADEVLRTGCEVGGEFFLTASNGRTFWIDTAMSRLVQDDHSYLMVVVKNIDVRKGLETALRESEELLRTFIRHSPVYTFIKDEQLRAVHLSDNFRELIGLAPEETLGRPTEEVFPADFAARVEREDRAILASGRRVELEETLGERTFRTIKFPFTLGGKKFIAGYATDITAQRHLEEVLRFQAERLRVLSETSLDCFWVIDLDGNILEINDRGCAMYGYSRDEILTLTLGEIEADETPNEIRLHLDVLIERGYDRFRTHHRRKNGEIFPVEVSVSIFREANTLMAFIRDLSCEAP